MKDILQGTLPLVGTDVAAKWNDLYYFLFYVCLVFFIIVIFPMVYFVIKYRAKPGQAPSTTDHNMPLEILWTAIPTVLVLIIFAWGWIVYKQMVDIPRDAYQIRVVAKSWQWNFQYEDGRILTNQLFVPANTNIKLLMTSEQKDVLHSFFVPDFRVKKDVVPGYYTTVFFNSNMPGQHQVLCAQYCGTGHSDMLAKVIVLDAEQWKLWKWGKDIQLPPAVGLGSLANPVSADTTNLQKTAAAAGLSLSLVDEGKKLTEIKGCMACHTSDGSKKVGPTYKGLFNHQVELSNGTKVLADENFIRMAIEVPQSKVTKGFEGIVMPPYAGQLSSMEMNALVEYIKSLK